MEVKLTKEAAQSLGDDKISLDEKDFRSDHYQNCCLKQDCTRKLKKKLLTHSVMQYSMIYDLGISSLNQLMYLYRRFLHNSDAMAVEKLADGIRKFAADQVRVFVFFG